MYCRNCGALNADTSKYCESCGEKLNDNTESGMPVEQEAPAISEQTLSEDAPVINQTTKEDAPTTIQSEPSQDASSVGLGILCFFFPVVGLVLFLVWRENLPKRAKSCGIGALIGAGVGALLTIIYFVAVIALIVALD